MLIVTAFMKLKFFSHHLFFLALLLCTSAALAQRGKISGKITDAETKEPLTGVNILLKGTAQGAVSDVNGNYVILGIQPGHYTLIARMIGYQAEQVTDIAVNIDRTTAINVALHASSVQMNAVIVQAQQPVIVKDRTSTSTTFEGRDVQTAPVEGLRDVMDLTASLQRNPNGTYSVRGSGAYEINFMINGVEQMNSNTGIPGFSAIGDKANNSWKYDFNPLSVQQMELVTGGFSAEYGNAQAGVVKVVTKEGGAKLTGQFRYEYRPPGQYHWGDYIYNTNSVEWQKWGTLDGWKANLDSNTIKRTYLQADTATMSVDAWRKLMWQQWLLNHTPSDNNLLGVYDYRQYAYQRVLFSFGGPLGKDSDLLRFFIAGEYRSNPTRIPTVEKIQTYQNYNITATYQPVATQKIRFTGLYQSYRGGLSSGSDDIRWAGYDASYKYYLVTDSPRDEYTTTQSIDWTYTINQESFLDVLATHQFEKYLLLEMPVPQRAASWRDNVYNGVWYQSAGPWDEGYRTIFSFTTFNQQDLRDHQFNLNVDYANQFTASHYVKMGLRATYWDMINSAVYSSFAANAFITRSGYAEYYKAYPYYLAAYAQDKMEFEGMVANVGVRVDGYNFNTAAPIDRFAPFYFAEGFNPDERQTFFGNPITTMPKTFFTVSPRLGLSFPIGEATAFRLQYGHFTSMPIFKQAYTRTNELGWATYGNPDLGPKTTINYELGVQHSFAGTHRLDVVAYYNDRVSQVDVLHIKALSGDTRKNEFYTTYDNNQFGASRGIEVTLEKIARGAFTYRFSYSLSRTTYGNYGPQYIYSADPNDPRNYQNPYAPTDYLSYDDRTHTFRSLVTYSTEKNGGMSFFGIKPFSDMTISMIYTAQSGSPYTYVPDYDPLIQAYKDGRVINNRRFPLEAKTDLNIDKSLMVFGFEMQLGIRIMNLFDNRWLTPLDGGTDALRIWANYGITEDNPIFETPGTPFSSANVYKFNFFRAYRNIPRQVFITVGTNF